MKKKILIVVPYIPYPLNSGGKIAQYTFIERMRFFFDITIIFTYKIEEIDHVKTLSEKWNDVIIEPYLLKETKSKKIISILYNFKAIILRILGIIILYPKNKTYLDRLLIKNSTLFRSKYYSLSIDYINHFKNLVENSDFDFVQIEFHQLISFVKYIPNHIKTIYVDHELRFIREERELKLLSFNSPFLRYIYKINKEYEINYLNKYKLVCVLSENDQRIINNYILEGKIYNSPIALFYQTEDTLIKADNFIFKNDLVFLGGENHFPNNEGLNWFLQNCWNSLKSQFPNLKLKIVGEWSAQTSYKLTSIYVDIEFLGFLDEIKTQLKNSVFIIPIRIGSGVRIKIIDAINIGAPFVSTTIGLEGLEFRNSFDCLVSDHPSEFCSHIADIILNPSLGMELINNSKNTLRNKYNFDVLIQKRISMYSDQNFLHLK
ncbi:glycosyltransferase [Spirosoma radiotolerans]|uniref:Glycosyltransferase n=1 Tax=Spirosoma radiotolerans TaxID=1379870 RepID=A0A0E3V7P2_9BACT|nr:glycosyltransferase [Spirosoma radiotolerans]AKD56047.1 hypothetical protein SD10_15230 [Spirosoma radiotolerans]